MIYDWHGDNRRGMHRLAAAVLNLCGTAEWKVETEWTLQCAGPPPAASRFQHRGTQSLATFGKNKGVQKCRHQRTRQSVVSIYSSVSGRTLPRRYLHGRDAPIHPSDDTVRRCRSRLQSEWLR